MAQVVSLKEIVEDGIENYNYYKSNMRHHYWLKPCLNFGYFSCWNVAISSFSFSNGSSNLFSEFRWSTCSGSTTEPRSSRSRPSSWRRSRCRRPPARPHRTAGQCRAPPCLGSGTWRILSVIHWGTHQTWTQVYFANDKPDVAPNFATQQGHGFDPRNRQLFFNAPFPANFSLFSSFLDINWQIITF